MKTLRDQLIGTWSIVSYETRAAGGSIEHPMGKKLLGYLMYAPPAFMSANLMIPGTPPFASGDMSSGSPDELATAARNYFGYAGRFEIDETAGAVKHHIEVALAPNLVNTVQKRYVRMEGDRLILTGDPARIGGRLAAPIITWRRCT